jgi:hypothetical protein
VAHADTLIVAKADGGSVSQPLEMERAEIVIDGLSMDYTANVAIEHLDQGSPRYRPLWQTIMAEPSGRLMIHDGAYAMIDGPEILTCEAETKTAREHVAIAVTGPAGGPYRLTIDRRLPVIIGQQPTLPGCDNDDVLDYRVERQQALIEADQDLHLPSGSVVRVSTH